MTGSETRLNWRVTSSNRSSQHQNGEPQSRPSPPWHTASFRTLPDAPNPSPGRRRSSAKVEQRRRRRPPKDPCPVRCACCCLPNLSNSSGCCVFVCRGGRRRRQEQSHPQEPPSPPSVPPVPPDQEPPERPTAPPPPSPPPQPPQPPQEQRCPCLHFLGGSPYYPAPEPNTWQFVYWPPMVPKSQRRSLPDRKPRLSFSQTQEKSESGPRRSKSTRVREPRRASSDHSQSNGQPKRSNDENCYCKGGWRCPCSKYELPESCVLAPLPATSAPTVETTLLVPTSTRVVVPAAGPGLCPRTFRVCMPPSELPMCHCPPDCPCPHPRCSTDTGLTGPCAGLHHPKPDGNLRPCVLFGRDPLIHNNV